MGFIMDNLFFYGLGLVGITFVIGLMLAKPYTEDNFQSVASTQRKLCISYVVGFGCMAYGARLFFEDTWWSWLIIIVSGMMGFGALLEAMKTLPNAPKDAQGD